MFLWLPLRLQGQLAHARGRPPFLPLSMKFTHAQRLQGVRPPFLPLSMKFMHAQMLQGV